MKKKVVLMTMALTASVILGACAQGAGTGEAGAGAVNTGNAGYLEAVNVSDYVTLGDVSNLKVTFPPVEVTEEEIDNRLSSYESQLTPVEVTDRDTAEEGDVLNVDYSGKLKSDGTVFEGGTAEGQTVEIGASGYIEGFAEGMIGHKVGETFDEEVTFPEEYPNDETLAGQEVIFTVTIHKISKRPVLNDETVAILAETDLNISGMTSMQDLRDYIKSELISQKESANQSNLSTFALEEAVKVSTFSETLPEEALARFEEQIKMSYEQMAAYYTQYFGATDTTADSLMTSDMEAESFEGTAEEYVHDKAVNQLKQMLVCYAVFDKEGLSYSEEELKSSIANVLLQNGYKSVAEFEEQNGINLKDAQTEQLKYGAAVNWLKEHAQTENGASEAETQDTSEASTEDATAAESAATEGESADAGTTDEEANASEDATAAETGATDEESDASTDASTGASN